MAEQTQGKCPKCGLEGEQVSDCPVAIMHPPEAGTYPFGRPEYKVVHIIDSPACLRRQLVQAKAVMPDLLEACEALILIIDNDAIISRRLQFSHDLNGLRAAIAKAKASKGKHHEGPII